jgi:diadenosine tetraphosphatase ApaH/serine/threonine PP2A family protein phosphatase
VTRVELPDLCLVLLFGAPHDVSKIAEGWFNGSIVRELADVGPRLAARHLTTVDATNLTRDDLTRLGRVANEHFVRAFAVVTAQTLVHLEQVVAVTTPRLKALRVMEVYAGLVDDIVVQSSRVVTDRRHERGPFDIIGDVHGCADELVELLGQLGYRVSLVGDGEARRAHVLPPPGRRAAFIGDLVDRGPKSPDVLRLVMSMVAEGSAVCVAGNHDAAFLRWLDGRNTRLSHGLDRTVSQMELQPLAFRKEVRSFLADLRGHLWLDDGALAIAHAGVLEPMFGRATGPVRAFTLYGDTSGKPAADGLPVRYHWALNYQSATTVVYGHTPVSDVAFVNNTLCIDTGCCFGGRLTAMRWPECEIVSVAAREIYTVRMREFGHPPARPVL